MKRFCILVCVLCAAMLMAGNALALNIQVSPQMLVLSSSGGKLTVHTDMPFSMADVVTLTVNGTEIAADTFADACGNLVAQCSKDAAKEVIGEFDGKTTTATVALDVDGDSDSEVIRVKK